MTKTPQDPHADDALGMDQSISRRDFMSGTALGVAAASSPLSSALGAEPAGTTQPAYPPLRSGMRGAHPGSYEAAHGFVTGDRWEAQQLSETYDLIVVGGGISGLSAAYIYRRDVNPEARILILDNHDDFGGHAKRNEFELDGETYIGFGGTMLMEEPSGYPAVVKQVINELGIPYQNTADYYDDGFFARNGLGQGTFYDAASFGRDHLALGDKFDAAVLDGAPLSPAAKVQLRKLFEDKTDYLASLPDDVQRSTLSSLSYRDYLATYAKLGDEALRYVQKRSHGVWAIGADALPAQLALLDGYPGFGRGKAPEDDEASAQAPDYFFFPDGNASIARHLVKALIPGSAKSNQLTELVSERLDYTALDGATNAVRLRLYSMVIDLRHQQNESGAVDVSYVRDGKAYKVTGSAAIWAGYHAMLPHICPDLPASQAEALATSERAPLTYTTVLLRNWQALKALGCYDFYCPGSFFQTIRMTFPLKMGAYHSTQSPDQPVVLHMQHIPTMPGEPAAQQFRQGRGQLLATPFETFERNLRRQLTAMLAPGGFDAARDIAAITVNRWPHGYAYSTHLQTGAVAFMPDAWPAGQRPWEAARQRIGNIAIAGSDAASNAMTEAAIEEAHRAVQSFLTG
ncbi:MAG: NAD(P)-binding protein [Pseudomonadota bacterium]